MEPALRRWAIGAALIAASLGGEAGAAPVNVSGSITIAVGTLPAVVIPIALATVDVTGGVLTVPAGIASVSGYAVPVVGFPLDLVTGMIVTASNAAGVFSVPAPGDGGAAHVAGGGFGGKMAIVGVVQVKGALAVNVPISVVGEGGSVSAGGVVVEGAPWTTGAARVTTTGPGMAIFSRSGEAPVSSVVLVTPAHVNAAGLMRLPVFASLSINVPEPAPALLLGAGIAGLAAVGLRRR